MNSSLLREFGDCIFQLQQRLTDEDSTINLIVKKINDHETRNQGKIPRELIKLKKDLVSLQNSEIRDNLSKQKTHQYFMITCFQVKQLREIAGNFENQKLEFSPIKVESEASVSQSNLKVNKVKSRKRFGRGNYKIADEKTREHAINIVF